jgi:cytochrome P450
MLTSIAANQKEHARIRKFLAPAFSDSSLLEQEPLLSQYFDALISKLKGQIEGSSEGRVDLMAHYNFVIFDIIRDVGS